MADFTSEDYKAVLGRFATGVTVITTQIGPHREGITVNSFTSVSLDPPLVLICIERAAHIHSILLQAGVFAANILSAEQATLSDCFARSSDFRNYHMCGCDLTTAATGAPILKHSAGYVDCRVVNVFPGGDHSIIVGQVEALGGNHNDDPLIYYQGGYRGRGDQ